MVNLSSFQDHYCLFSSEEGRQANWKAICLLPPAPFSNDPPAVPNGPGVQCEARWARWWGAVGGHSATAEDASWCARFPSRVTRGHRIGRYKSYAARTHRLRVQVWVGMLTDYIFIAHQHTKHFTFPDGESKFSFLGRFKLYGCIRSLTE